MLARLRSRLTFANVTATIALFLALSGGAAYAAVTLPANSVGTKQLKKKAVTRSKIASKAVNGSKVADDSLTGAKIVEASLAQVPSAANADHASSADTATNAGKLENHPASDFVSATTLLRFGPVKLTTGQNQDVLTIGPFKFTAQCAINVAGVDRAELFISTSEDNSAVDASDTDADFDAGDTGVVFADTIPTTGTPSIDSESDGSAVAPGGTQLEGNTYAAVNILNTPGQCVFGGAFVVG